MLRYSKNNGHVKLYNMQSLSDCVYLSYLNTQIVFWTGPPGCKFVKLEWPQIDFDRPQALGAQFLEPCISVDSILSEVDSSGASEDENDDAWTRRFSDFEVCLP